MKKIISFIFILFLVGCNKKDFITCDIEVDNKLKNYTMSGTYKIYYNDNYVTNIEEKEIYISSDKEIIEYFYESKDLDYYNLNDIYKGYNYDIKKDDTSVSITSNIDMSLVNIKKMLKNKEIDKDYVISNKLTTSGAVKIYESKGAICDI